MTTLLATRGLTVSFGGVRAVNDLSFEVRKNELLGLIGPNGAGKTTVVRALTGAVIPDAGTVRLNDTALNRLPTFRRVRLGLGVSQQIVRPFTNMTALDNVAFAVGRRHTNSVVRSMTRVSRKIEREKARMLMQRLDIEEFADSLPGQLPLGVLKRLELARALALDPILLLLDEPLAGLNSLEASHIANAIADLVSDEITVVLIEHNLGEVVRVCTRLIVIDNGIQISQGIPGDVIADPAVRKAYLGS